MYRDQIPAVRFLEWMCDAEKHTHMKTHTTERKTKETISTRPIVLKKIQSLPALGSNEKQKKTFRDGRRYGWGFSRLLCRRIWGLRQVILPIGTSISLKHKICLAEKSLLCSASEAGKKPKKTLFRLCSCHQYDSSFYFLTVMTALLTEKCLKL